MLKSILKFLDLFIKYRFIKKEDYMKKILAVVFSDNGQLINPPEKAAL